RHLAQDRLEERSTEGTEPVFRSGFEVMVAGIDRRVDAAVNRGRAEDQAGVEVGLEENVDVDPLGEVTSVDDVSPLRQEGLDSRYVAVLNGEPVAERGAEVLAGRPRPHPPIDELDAERSVEPHELGDVGADLGAGESVAEEGLRRDLATDLRAAEVREPVEVGDGSLGERVRVVASEVDVAQQRLPVVLDHLSGDLGAAKGGCRRYRVLVRVGPFAVEGE